MDHDLNIKKSTNTYYFFFLHEQLAPKLFLQSVSLATSFSETIFSSLWIIPKTHCPDCLDFSAVVIVLVKTVSSAG